MEHRLALLKAAVEARSSDPDPAHDFLHVLRVTENARLIGMAEGADLEVVLAAALLHELFNYPKNHPESHLSGEVCADQAADLLRQLSWPEALIGPTTYCIRVHSFSRGIYPETLEGRILQDADRLDAIGAIGIARCFATCSSMQTPFYHPGDPFCRTHEPDDKQWGIDHFYRKLLKIPDGLHTATARALAADRSRFMTAFLEQLERELPPR